MLTEAGGQRLFDAADQSMLTLAISDVEMHVYKARAAAVQERPVA